MQRISQRNAQLFSSMPSAVSFVFSAIKSNVLLPCLLISTLAVCTIAVVSAQTRRRRQVKRPMPKQAPRGSATKYSAFLHSSDKHKSLQCNACHKIPTAWNAKRAFPDVADFPDHDACVRCHRPQFFSGQATIGTGPAIVRCVTYVPLRVKTPGLRLAGPTIRISKRSQKTNANSRSNFRMTNIRTRSRPLRTFDSSSHLSPDRLTIRRPITTTARSVINQTKRSRSRPCQYRRPIRLCSIHSSRCRTATTRALTVIGKI